MQPVPIVTLTGVDVVQPKTVPTSMCGEGSEIWEPRP
jgi:hypothetical protein